MPNMCNWNKNLPILILVILACVIWYIPAPEGLDVKVWHLSIIFITTIAAIILNPLPMGAIALFSILCCILTQTLSLEQSLSGFSHSIIWLVLLAFFIAQGFIKTGFGERIAYHIILLVGQSTLGISYALVIVDFILAPFIPSVCARGGGIIFPIAQSLCTAYSNKTNYETSVSNGGFLMKVVFQSNVITSAMFITSMAANPLAVKFAADAGIIISWSDWAIAAIVPGVISLAVMPLILYYLHPPSIKYDPSAIQIARAKLQEIGDISLQEIIMLITFVILIFLWMLGSKWGLSATTVALLGVCILLLCKVIKFEDTLADKGAWHTFIWYGTLVMISSFLSDFGLIAWVSDKLRDNLLSFFSPMIGIIILSVIYFYIHYFFASTTTHIAILFPTFLALFIHAKMPSLLSVLLLSFLSILSSGLTHYGLSSAPIYFETGYMKIRTWWYLGLVLSLVYGIIWIFIGGMWWKTLGLW
ncbi:DASS family sodium-coupled anion symporter [Candidatus Tisiphia endosymbiont of Melanophora roralis]|uniref:DASS family sodium-coupled anion symporter n=1 Tax=Candidatus Tisiphia endosymbiont of Melanophora roralis TaxID=3066261 RepID=UPI00312CAA64